MKTTVILVLMFASLAFGATVWTYRHNVKVAGKTMLGTQTETNVITRSLYGTVAWNFTEAGIECEDSVAATVTGAVVNDPCFLGLVDMVTLNSEDAGASASQFSCYVSDVNAVKVRHCPAGTATDPKDAGFTLRIISGL